MWFWRTRAILFFNQRWDKVWRWCNVSFSKGAVALFFVPSRCTQIHIYRIHFGNYGMTLIIIYKMMKIMIWRKWQTKSCSCKFGRHEPILHKKKLIFWNSCQEYCSFIINFSMMIDSLPIYILNVRWMYLFHPVWHQSGAKIFYEFVSAQFSTTSIIACCSNCNIFPKIPFLVTFSFLV